MRKNMKAVLMKKSLNMTNQNMMMEKRRLNWKFQRKYVSFSTNIMIWMA